MREILIIRTDNSEKIRAVLGQSEILHSEVVYENEEKYWQEALQTANQDETRNKEIAEWDKISDEDEWETIKDNDANWN